MNVEATRLAFKIAHWAPKHLGYVKLNEDGSLYATDGIAMVGSLRAHDLDIAEPVFLRIGSPSFAKNAEDFSINFKDGFLVEHRPRSNKEYRVEIHRGVKFPPVESQLPEMLGITTKCVPPFDSIRAGKIASEYGLDIGVWGKGNEDDRVYLKDVQPTDTVILASIRNGTLSTGGS